jgi:ABC-type glycerol-3-phosphate transport system substrate-binding protein
MDENTIFKPINEPKNEAGIRPDIPIDTVNETPPSELPSSPPPSKPLGLLKVFLGIFIFLVVIIVIFNLIFPKIFPTGLGSVTLTYWGILEDEPTLAPIITDFEKAHPGIKINYSKLSLDQYRNKLVARSNTGNGPDIFSFHNTWVPELTGILLPLPTSVVSLDDFSKNYYPVAKTDLVKNGVIYGIPLEIDTLNLFINKNLFQAAGLKAPATWIDFVNDARQLTVKDESNSIKTAGAAMGTFDNVTHAPDIISMLFIQNGVKLNDMSSNLPAAGDALTFYTSFAKTPGNIWDENMDPSIKAFASGSLAMYFGYSWDFFLIKSQNPDLAFDIYPVPSLPGQNITIASYWAEGISGKTKHQKEAILFMQYLAARETEQKLFSQESKVRNFGEPYSRVDLASTLSSSVAYPFAQSAPSALSSFFVDGTYDDGINVKMNNYLKASVNSILNGGDPQVEAGILSNGVSVVLRQYGQ